MEKDKKIIYGSYLLLFVSNILGIISVKIFPKTVDLQRIIPLTKESYNIFFIIVMYLIFSLAVKFIRNKNFSTFSNKVVAVIMPIFLTIISIILCIFWVYHSEITLAVSIALLFACRKFFNRKISYICLGIIGAYAVIIQKIWWLLPILVLVGLSDFNVLKGNLLKISFAIAVILSSVLFNPGQTYIKDIYTKSNDDSRILSEKYDWYGIDKNTASIEIDEISSVGIKPEDLLPQNRYENYLFAWIWQHSVFIACSILALHLIFFILQLIKAKARSVGVLSIAMYLDICFFLSNFGLISAKSNLLAVSARPAVITMNILLLLAYEISELKGCNKS